MSNNMLDNVLQQRLKWVPVANEIGSSSLQLLAGHQGKADTTGCLHETAYATHSAKHQLTLIGSTDNAVGIVPVNALAANQNDTLRHIAIYPSAA